ncbi:hypothetical protein PR048_031546 [Dryococelus australis]|uniref:CCHC-type domain-containing protein n=1 Tax=Dryococelus australis TaxID=614101 RepID=A0ABQ9G5L8_9NEOP|nr:hypothetical protein PR048_031546 [Dryococelus australis]
MQNGKHPVLKFQNYHNVYKVPIVMYVDFEAMLVLVQTCEQNPTASFTYRNQYGIYIKVDKDILSSKNTSMKVFTGEDAAKKFMEDIVRIDTLATKVISELHQIVHALGHATVNCNSSMHTSVEQFCFCCGEKGHINCFCQQQQQLGNWEWLVEKLIPGVLPDFHMWESCRAIPLVGGFSPGSPISPALSFQCYYPPTRHGMLVYKLLTRKFLIPCNHGS